MKRIRTGVFIYLLAHFGLLMGCYVGPVPTFETGEVEGMKPVYENELVISKGESRTLINPGKILLRPIPTCHRKAAWYPCV